MLFALNVSICAALRLLHPHAEMHKTALGAEFTVDWKYVNNTVEAVDNLKNEGYTVYSVEQVRR